MWRKQAIIEWSWWSDLGELLLINACEASEQLIVLTNDDDKSDLVISVVACFHRQTFLFNIWINQISGGKWLQGLWVILPREIQVELHGR